jgi:hypothetical protein
LFGARATRHPWNFRELEILGLGPAFGERLSMHMLTQTVKAGPEFQLTFKVAAENEEAALEEGQRERLLHW